MQTMLSELEAAASESEKRPSTFERPELDPPDPEELAVVRTLGTGQFGRVSLVQARDVPRRRRFVGRHSTCAMEHA